MLQLFLAVKSLALIYIFLRSYSCHVQDHFRISNQYSHHVLDKTNNFKKNRVMKFDDSFSAFSIR